MFCSTHATVENGFATRREPMVSWSRRLPELPLAGFGFLVHFVWEMLQVPWFTGMLEASHGSVVSLCVRATLGDVLILLAAFWAGSAVVRHRGWLVTGQRMPAVITVAAGVITTVIFEWLATGALGRWSYAEAMPVIPGIGIGLTPFLQWLLLPPLALWLTRNHILGSMKSSGGRCA